MSFIYVLKKLFLLLVWIFITTNSNANPSVISLGDPEKGSNRLNLAGGINSFGTIGWTNCCSSHLIWEYSEICRGVRVYDQK